MKAIITGATKGIGRAIAFAMAGEGYNLAICSRSNEDLASLKAEINSAFPNTQVLFQKTDMSVRQDVLSFASFVRAEWPDIDVLVNNAGIFLPGILLEEEDGALEKMVETNLYSAYYLTRAIAPAMVARGKGHIFNMCSIASFMAYPNGGSYSISKFALLGFSKVLREEIKSSGVKVTSILPGATWSNSWAGVDLPRERLMLAEDIAESVISALRMSPSAVVEEIILRPQLGDL